MTDPLLLQRGDRVMFPDVLLTGDTGRNLICVVDGKQVLVSPLRVLSGTKLRSIGDRGPLVISKSLAKHLGLIGNWPVAES
jgi:hypothetical protein